MFGWALFSVFMRLSFFPLYPRTFVNSDAAKLIGSLAFDQYWLIFS